MNFDHINKVSDFDRNKLFPHWSNKLTAPDFGQYLAQMAETKSGKWLNKELKVLPITYFIDPEKFSKKYAKKCVSFAGTTNPQEGAFQVIYQISPTFHVVARLFQWIEHEEVKAYFTLMAAYKSFVDYNTFFDENTSLRITGNSEERIVGFNDNPLGFNDLVKQMDSDVVSE